MIFRSQQLQLSLLFSSLVVLLVFALSGCGQSATPSDSGSNTQSQNGTTEPGYHQSKDRITGSLVYTAGQTVALYGSSSSDPDSLSYQRTKTTEPDITLSNITGSSLSFVVPSIEQSQQISFQLTVGDSGGHSNSSSVSMPISPIVDNGARSIVSRPPSVLRHVWS